MEVQLESVFVVANNCVFAGKVLSGEISIGQRVEIHSTDNHIPAKVNGVELSHKVVAIAKSGDEVALMFSDVDFDQITDGIEKDSETGAITIKSLTIHSSSKKWWQFW